MRFAIDDRYSPGTIRIRFRIGPFLVEHDIRYVFGIEWRTGFLGLIRTKPIPLEENNYETASDNGSKVGG
jgi:hypothetical protein